VAAPKVILLTSPSTHLHAKPNNTTTTTAAVIDPTAATTINTIDTATPSSLHYCLSSPIDLIGTPRSASLPRIHYYYYYHYHYYDYYYNY